MLEIPYNKLEIVLAAVELETEFNLDKEKLSQKLTGINAEIQKEFGISNAEMNKRTAKDNGIAVKTLINSPNYKLLLQLFLERRTKHVVEEIKTKFEFTDIQAWLMIAIAFKVPELEKYVELMTPQ